MPLLTLTEASIYSGYSPELLQYFSKNCPKYNENKKLNFQTISDLLHFDESDLKNYIKYLKEPWPVKDNATRAYIPDAIKDDIKKESHFQCAICGHMDNGEIAHIEPYKQTLNNSPDNLIFLCPNHHSKYDYGHKLSSNITTEVIWETKKIKRESSANLELSRNCK